jgi:hypothetical protein
MPSHPRPSRAASSRPLRLPEARPSPPPNPRARSPPCQYPPTTTTTTSFAKGRPKYIFCIPYPVGRVLGRLGRAQQRGAVGVWREVIGKQRQKEEGHSGGSAQAGLPLRLGLFERGEARLRVQQRKAVRVQRCRRLPVPVPLRADGPRCRLPHRHPLRLHVVQH